MSKLAPCHCGMMTGPCDCSSRDTLTRGASVAAMLADGVATADPAEQFRECTWCNGRGFYGSPGKRCEWCDGDGKVIVPPDFVKGPTSAAAGVKALDGCEFCLGAKGGVPGNENRIGGHVVCDYCTPLATDIQRAAGVQGAPAAEPKGGA